MDVVGAAGSELEALIAPLTPSTFVDEYLGRRSLYVPSAAGRFRALFDRDALDALLMNVSRSDGRRMSVRRVFVAPENPRKNRGTPIATDQVADAVGGGATIEMSGIETFEPRLGLLAERLASRLSMPLDGARVTCWLAGPGARTAVHYDSCENFVLQIDGKKTWRYSECGRNDYEVPYVDVPAPDASELTSVVLTPGDFLYLPGGAWHEPHATHSESLHVTVTLTALNARDVVRDALRGLDLRPLPAHDARARGSERDMLRMLRRDLSAITARLQRVRDAELEHLVRRVCHRSRLGFEAIRIPTDFHADEPLGIAPDHPLVFTGLDTRTCAGDIAAADASVYLYWGPVERRVDTRLAAFLRENEKRTFTARMLAGQIAHAGLEDVMEAVRDLASEGVVILMRRDAER